MILTRSMRVDVLAVVEVGWSTDSKFYRSITYSIDSRAELDYARSNCGNHHVIGGHHLRNAFELDSVAESGSRRFILAARRLQTWPSLQPRSQRQLY